MALKLGLSVAVARYDRTSVGMALIKAEKSPGNAPQLLVAETALVVVVVTGVLMDEAVVEALLVVVVVTGVLVDEAVAEVAGPVYEKLWLHQSDGTPPVNLGISVAVAR